VLSELSRAQGWRNLRSLSQATGESTPTVYRLLLLLHARGYVLRSQRRRCFFALAPVQPGAVKECGKKGTENCESSHKQGLPLLSALEGTLQGHPTLPFRRPE